MRPILVMGARGMLGSSVLREGWKMNMPMVGVSKEMCDITNPSQMKNLFSAYRDPIIINCAGLMRGRATKRMGHINGRGPHLLKRYTSRLVQVSTDCVFDGKIETGAYTEDSETSPEDVYAQTKLVGEVTDDGHVTVRGSCVGIGERGLLRWLLDRQAGSKVPGYTDRMWNGMTSATFARWLLSIAISPKTGLIHLVGPEELSKFELLRMVAHDLRLPVEIEPVERGPRRRMVLASRRMDPVPESWHEMLAELVDEYV
jgi:dTDP-4-dehydrorhamnose reductase